MGAPMVEELGIKIENIAVSDLGKAKRINIDKVKTARGLLVTALKRTPTRI